MDTLSEILIISLTLLITILPFTGELWERKNKLKVLWRGHVFLISSLIILASGTFVIIRNSKKDNLRDSQRIQTLNNTNTLIDDVNLGVSKIEDKLLRIDSLNIKLDTLENKTVASIKRRDNILSDFNKLNTKLEKIYIQEESKIKENIPVVDILDNVAYYKENGVYKIQAILTNSGGRVAKELYLDTWFFQMDNSGNILNHKLLSNDVSGGDDLPPVKISNKKLRYGFPNFPKLSPTDSLTRGYLLIEYEYKDFILDTTFYITEKYVWRNVNLDGMNWVSMPKSYNKILESYLTKNKIKTKNST